MKKYPYLLLILMIRTIAFSQNPSIVPDNVPGAYTDYLYTLDEVLVSKNEIYRSQFPKIKYPPDLSNTNKEDLKLDVYYTPVGSNCIGNRPLIVLVHGGGNGVGATIRRMGIFCKRFSSTRLYCCSN